MTNESAAGAGLLENPVGYSGSRLGRGWVLIIVFGAIAVFSGIAIFGPFPNELIATFVIVNMVSLLFLRVPLAVSMFIPSLLGLWAVRSVRLPQETLTTLPFDEVASWSFSVIPMYILLGVVLARSGFATDLYRLIAVVIPGVPGNLAVASNLTGGALSTVSGSTMSAVLTMLRVGVPEMLRAGYDRRIAIGAVIIAGLSGPLIPPSVLAIIYAGVAGTGIGPQLLAGLLPGILVIVVFTIAIIVIALIRPGLVGKGDRKAPRPVPQPGEVRNLLKRAWVFPLIIVIIFGGMYSGFFTATEAGAVAALIAIVVALPGMLRQRSLKSLWESMGVTLASTGAIFFLIMGASALSRLVVLSGLGRLFVDFIDGFGLNALQFLLVMMLVYIVLGMVMDTLPLILMTVPIVLPILDTLEISPIWYGVFLIIMCEVSMLTPPVGSLLYITHRSAQDPDVNLGQRISIGDVLKAVYVIVPIALIVVVLLIAFPDIAMFIPDTSSAG